MRDRKLKAARLLLPAVALVSLLAGRSFAAPSHPSVPGITCGEEGNTVSWEAVPEAASYTVMKQTGDGEWAEAVSLSGDCVLWEDPEVRVSGCRYAYSVIAMTKDGFSSGNTAGFAETVYVAQVSGLTAVPDGKDVRLFWAADEGAAGYVVERRTDGGIWETVTETDSFSVCDASAKAEGCAYIYRVTAFAEALSGERYCSLPAESKELKAVASDEEEGGIRMREASLLLRDEIVAKAMSLAGCPYRTAGNTPAGFDCSGFTSYVYACFGIDIGRDCRSQYAKGTPVPYEELKPGDLVYFATMGRGYNSHAGMYIGNGLMIHSPHSGDVVHVEDITEGYYAQRYLYGCRFIDD